MVKVWLGALAPLLKHYPYHFKLFNLITNVMLTWSYHSHPHTMFKSLQDILSGVRSKMHLFLLYRKSYSINIVPNIHTILHSIKCTREMDFSDSSDTKVSKATHKGIIQDGYHSFNLFNYILLILY
jgi:hypothetical protein